MKCNYCTADVPPEWTFSINTNTCPSCGGALMSSDQQHILSELRDAMTQMPNNPEGIAGWLLTNYNLQKVDEKDVPITTFHQRKMQDGNDFEDRPSRQNSKDQPSDKKALINKFFKRAGINASKIDDMKDIASRVKAGQNENLDMSTIDDGEFDPEQEYIETASAVQMNDPLDRIPTLQKGRMKRENSLEAVLSGSGGAFRRSS